MENQKQPSAANVEFAARSTEISDKLARVALELEQEQEQEGVFESNRSVNESNQTDESYNYEEPGDNYDVGYDDDYEDSEGFDEDFEFEPKTINEIAVDQEILRELNLPNLPPGYAFMGGAARAVYQKQLLGEKVYVRDLDIVAVTDFAPDLEVADDLSRTYMPDDYNNGHGVKAENLEYYFASRDFTMNEILVTAEKIYATPEAETALTDKIIELTTFEKDSDGYSKKQKLAAKAVLLEQIVRAQYGKGKIADPNDIFSDEIRPFFVALQLNKALQFSDSLGQRYIASLADYNLIDQDYRDLSIEQVCQRLSDECGPWGFEFTYQDNRLDLSTLEDDLLDQSEGLLGSQIYAENNYPDALLYGSLKQRDRVDRKTGRKFRDGVEI